MVIVDEKTLLPPPPYAAADPTGLPPFPRRGGYATFAHIPPYLLLRIVHELFPQGQPAGQRKILYWLTMSLRRVNRALYVACMHVLRSTYLPAYNLLLRAPYTSDPFPGPDPDHDQSDSLTSPVQSLQRETRVLDLFIALKVREDVWADDSELHLEREESFKDLFDLMQPRSRLEDLVRKYGTREGVVSISVASADSNRQRAQANAVPSGSRRLPTGVKPLPFSLLSVSFSPRRVGLVLSMQQRKKTIVEVDRRREDTLEASAKQLARELVSWLFANRHYVNAI